MSIKLFTEELETSLRGGIESLVGWIKANPTATAGQAQDVVRNWVANNTDYSEAWADKLSQRILSITAQGTWAAFRSTILLRSRIPNTELAREVMRAAAN